MGKTQSTLEKSALRTELLQVRKGLSPALTPQWDSEICRHIRSFLRQYPVAQGVGFLPFPGEPDLRTLMAPGKTDLVWGVPMVANGLHFYPWTPSTQLRKSPFGFWEPETQGEPMDFAVPTLILVPAVGLDPHGHRIGFGKGHYDRFLPKIPAKTCFTMGVVYDACLREALPQDPWDIPLSHICTQSGWRST